jgi:CheY-like chemotaxis protein
MKSDSRFRISFRSWLALLTALAVGFGGAVMLVSSSFDAQQKRTDEARMVLERAAVALAVSLDDELHAIARDLNLATQNDVLLLPDTHAAALRQYLANWQKFRPEYADILLADRAGRIRATASASNLGADVSGSLWFGKALGEIAVGESTHNVQAGVELPPKVIVGAPLSRDGQMAGGVLAVQLNQSWIDDLIAGVRRNFGAAGPRISFEIMDAGGRLIHKPEIPGHATLNAQIMEATAPDDTRQAPRLGWLIVARGAAADIIAVQATPWLIALIIAAMMGAGAVAWIMGGRLARHIGIARGIALGQAPGESLKPLRVEELQNLVETIVATNTRAQSKERLLQDTKAALLRSRERVRAFESIAGWNCWDIDIANGLVTWNEAWTDAASPMMSAASENIMALDEFYDRLEPGDRDMLRAALAADGEMRDASLRMLPSEGETLGRRLLLRMKSADDSAPASRVFVLSREIGSDRLDVPIARPLALGQALAAPERRSDDAAAGAQISTGMIDDINNALSVIMMALGSVTRKNGIADEVVWSIEAAFRGAKQGAARLCDGGASSSSETAGVPQIDVAEVMQDLGAFLHISAAQRFTLKIAIAPDLPPVLCSAQQFEAVLLGLIFDTRAALIQNGVVSISIDRAAVAPKARHAGRPGVKLSFSAFTDLAKGRGLASVGALMEQIGGSIDIKISDRESTIGLWFPATDSRTGVRSPSRVSRLFNILFVDANGLVRSTASRVLADLGHTVTQATSGLDAMQILAERRDFDMMIADHANPGLDGLRLAGVVSRTHPLMRIILTGSRGHFPEGAKSFQQLNKPFGAQELALAVQAAPSVQASGGLQTLAAMTGRLTHQGPRGGAA